MPSAPFGFGGVLGGGPVPDVQMPDGLPVSGGKGSPLVDAFLALQGQRIRDAVTAPRDAYTGDLQVMGPDGHPTAEAMDRASGLAGLAMTGGFAGVAAAPAETVLGMGAPRRLTFNSPLFGSSRITEKAAQELLENRKSSIAATAADPSLGTIPQTIHTEVERLEALLPRFSEPPGGPRGRPFTPLRPVEGDGPFAVKVQEHPDFPDSRQYRIYDQLPDGRLSRPRGTADVSREPDGRWRTDMLETREGQQGRGLATALYDALEQDTGQKRVPSGQLLPDGYRFWSKRDPDAVQYHQPFGDEFWSPRRIKERLDDPSAYASAPEKRAELQAAFDRVPPEGKTPEALALQHYAIPGALGLGAGAAAFAQASDAQAGELSPIPLTGAPPVSSGLAPFGALSAADIARLMQQARPQVGDEDVPAAIPPGFSGFVPPTAPTMQPTVAAAPQASEPAGSMQAPLRMFGSLPPQMPVQAAPDAAPGPMPSLVGSQAPAMPSRAPVAASEDAPTAPAPARPLSFGALPAPVSPAPATTGSVPAAGSSTTSPNPASPSAEPSFLDRIGSGLRSLNANGGSDLLMSLGMGLMSTPGFGRGAAVGFKNYQDNEGKRAASTLAQAEFGLKARKAQQEQGVQNMTARAIMTKMPGTSPEDAVALAGNPDFVKSFLSGNYGAPEGYVRTPSGLVPVAGGPQDPAALKARAQAQAEGTAAGAKDDVQVITRPDGSIVGVNKSRIGEADGPSPLMPVAPPTAGTRVWGTPGPDGQIVAPPPGTPAGTPGYYDEKGAPHVALTQGTNQLPQKANLELDQAAVKAITESRAKAEGAIGTLGAINRQKEALDKGIVAGAGADWRTQARAITAQVLGIPDSYVTNSQLFDQAATQKSAELAKAISQAGHTTNMDLQLGKTISSGDRSSVEAALRAGIEAQEILAKKTIEHHNASVDRFATPETAQRAGFFKVEQPEIYQYKPPAPDRSAVEAEMRRRGMMR